MGTHLTVARGLEVTIPGECSCDLAWPKVNTCQNGVIGGGGEKENGKPHPITSVSSGQSANNLEKRREGEHLYREEREGQKRGKPNFEINILGAHSSNSLKGVAVG